MTSSFSNSPENLCLQRVWLSTISFTTEKNFDFLDVYEGDSIRMKDLIDYFSGNNGPSNVLSTTNALTLWFYTDNVNHRNGFALRFEFQGK